MQNNATKSQNQKYRNIFCFTRDGYFFFKLFLYCLIFLRKKKRFSNLSKNYHSDVFLNNFSVKLFIKKRYIIFKK